MSTAEYIGLAIAVLFSLYIVVRLAAKAFFKSYFEEKIEHNHYKENVDGKEQS